MDALVTAICLYRVSPGKEEAFLRLLERHWPTLRRLGLVREGPPQRYRGQEQEGGPLFVEIFDWASERAADEAHRHPEVLEIWEPMDALTESRGGRPNMEFPHVRRLDALA